MKDENRSGSLSRREKEVVELLLQGKSNKQMALSLGISERTVEFHLNNIYARLQVASRVELILKLGKPSGAYFEYPVESTVEIGNENTDNGNQSARARAARSWRNTVSLIKKEVAMTIKISFEDLENYLRSHPMLFSLLVFLAASLTVRFVVFELGLFFWVSYALLGLLLGAGAIRFGLSWEKITSGKVHFSPLVVIIFAALLPLIAAVFDQVYLNTVLRYTESVSTTFASISTRAEWLVASWGESYLSRERHTRSDDLWLWMNGLMVLLFLLSRLLGKRQDKNNLATA